MEILKQEIRTALLTGIETFSSAEVQAWYHLYHNHLQASGLQPCFTTVSAPDSLYLQCYYGEKKDTEDCEREVQSLLRYWLELEKPLLQGKQVVLQSFLLQQTRGRRVLAVLPEEKGWSLLLEGGVKITANGTVQPLTAGETGHFTGREVQEILYNPVHAFGYTYEPIDLFSRWTDALYYALAVNGVTDYTAIEQIYRDYCLLIEKEVCIRKNIGVTPTVDKGSFFEIQRSYILSIQEYLAGREVPVISKNMLMGMRSDWVYLRKILPIIRRYTSLPSAANVFNLLAFQRCLDALQNGDANARGRKMEELAHLALSGVNGLRQTGQRVRQQSGEVDLLFCNTSLDRRLWEMGALLLVECKNWRGKLPVSVVRNLAYVMDEKGVHTAVLFSREGLSAVTEEEIQKQVGMGRYFLAFDEGDYRTLASGIQMPQNMLLQKWDALFDRLP